MHSGRCILGQCAKHNSFEYNTVHHSWRQYYTVLVCAKLSYAGDSWQTLAQTIHGLHQGRGHCCHLSEERWEDRKSGTHAGDDMGHSSRSASFLLFIWKSSEKDAEVGTQLGHYDDQQRPVRCLKVFSAVFSLAKDWKMAININVSTQNFRMRHVPPWPSICIYVPSTCVLWCDITEQI